VVEYVFALSEWTERFMKVHRTHLPSSYFGTNLVVLHVSWCL